jgi:hypothetical protein
VHPRLAEDDPGGPELDGRHGLEVVFSSNRAGTLGAQDIWASTRDDFDSPWSAPVNLGGAVNTPAAETRPSLSKDARQLLFGRAPGHGSEPNYIEVPCGVAGLSVTSGGRSPGRYRFHVTPARSPITSVGTIVRKR